MKQGLEDTDEDQCTIYQENDQNHAYSEMRSRGNASRYFSCDKQSNRHHCTIQQFFFLISKNSLKSAEGRKPSTQEASIQQFKQ
jgi:hypothetical protein